jgi:uncharacterized protein YdeI (YjbR/CyaY-like superfamily)
MLDGSHLKRPIQPMPEFVVAALTKEHLLDDYQSRPPYQRNDYLLWIHSAKRQDTKHKRLRQMLEELRTGGVYMKMKHPASEKR